MGEFNEVLGKNIKMFMNKKGIAAKELADKADISETYLSYVINQKRNPSKQTIEKIADALEVSTDRLTGEAASSIIEEKIEELGITLEIVSEKTNVPLHWLQNLDTFIPGEWANGEVEYNWITRVAKVLGLPGSHLRAALARQEIPIYEGPSSDNKPEEDFNFVTPEQAFTLIEFDSEYLRRIPLVGRAAAGDPMLAIENPGEYIIIDTRINKVNENHIEEFYALEVAGQSMEPTIHDGEVVLVRMQPEIETGQVGVFRCNGDEATIKRFAKEGGKYYLIPDNKQYPALEVTEDCVCVGKVLESIRRKIK